MDWLGSTLTVSGLILVVLALTDSAGAPHQWRRPHLYVLFIVGSLLVGLAVYVEVWLLKTSSPV